MGGQQVVGRVEPVIEADSSAGMEDVPFKVHKQ